jgi:hypothetical protein
MIAGDTNDLMTTTEVAAALGAHPLAVRRMYLRGLVPEPRRAGRLRLISRRDLPAIAAALRASRYRQRRTDDAA